MKRLPPARDAPEALDAYRIINGEGTDAGRCGRTLRGLSRLPDPDRGGARGSCRRWSRPGRPFQPRGVYDRSEGGVGARRGSRRAWRARAVRSSARLNDSGGRRALPGRLFWHGQKDGLLPGPARDPLSPAHAGRGAARAESPSPTLGFGIVAGLGGATHVTSVDTRRYRSSSERRRGVRTGSIPPRHASRWTSSTSCAPAPSSGT